MHLYGSPLGLFTPFTDVSCHRCFCLRSAYRCQRLYVCMRIHAVVCFSAELLLSVLSKVNKMKQRTRVT